jgi:putative GTP pyrophosphokinase
MLTTRTPFDPSSLKPYGRQQRRLPRSRHGRKPSSPSRPRRSRPRRLTPERPKYEDPLAQITDLAAARVITFFPKSARRVEEIIQAEFRVLERADKAELLGDDRLGYQSVHYLVRLSPERLKLPEYQRFAELTCEIQVRTVLQHAWAEIEHDIQYKSVLTIPREVKRRFVALAGLLELADREFQAIQDEDARLRSTARHSVTQGRFHGIEITPDALKAYVDKQFGTDARMSDFSYQFTAKTIRQLGVETVEDLDGLVNRYNDDEISRIIWGNRQGQLTRLEGVLLTAMGQEFIDRHPWSNQSWFRERCTSWLEKVRENTITISVPLGERFDGLS